jgi:hypothetical protein
MDGLVSDPKHPSGFAALPLAVSRLVSPKPRAKTDAIIRTHMPDSPKSVPDSVPKSVPDSVPSSVPRSDSGSDPSKVVCERCGAEMYRMHAVWRCASCGFKTDCCGW